MTIIHRRPKLLTDVYPDKFRDAVVTNLEARGIDVVLDDTVDLDLPSGATSVTTHKGRTVSGDLIVRINHSFCPAFQSGSGICFLM